MVAMMIWVLALAASIAGVSLAAASEAKSAHLAATAFVTLGILAAAISDHRAAAIDGVSSYRLAAVASRYMGLMWAWSGVSAYVVYGFVMEWAESVVPVFAMFAACVLCLFVGFILDREAVAEVPDARTARLLGILSKSQFVLAAALFGILIAVQQRADAEFGGAAVWVATNLAMCTAAGLLCLTGYLLLHDSGETETSASTRT